MEEKSLRDRLNDELKKAMRERDQLKVSTLRLILAAVKEKDIQARTQGADETATDPEILSMLKSMIKQREESSKTYAKAGREDLARREDQEIAVIKQFLPDQLNEDELDSAISDIIKDSGAKDIKDMGQVMGELKKKYAGQIDMSRASVLVKEKLSS